MEASGVRRVPAHMPHLVDKDIMIKAQAKWEEEYAATSSHKFRRANDVQFSFAYFNFLMNDIAGMPLAYVWKHVLDVDGDGTLDANEMRTLAVLMKGKANLQYEPVDASWIQKVESEIISAQPRMFGDKRITFATLIASSWAVNELAKGLYGDGEQISPLIKDIVSNKFEIVELDEVTFKILKSSGDRKYDGNATDWDAEWDSLRAGRTKFICINDEQNEPSHAKSAALHNFLQSFLPMPSSFEKSSSGSDAHLRAASRA